LTFVEINTFITTVVKSVAALANTVERARVINTDTARTTNVELLITLVSIDAGIVALLVANWAFAFIRSDGIGANVLAVVVLCLALVEVDANIIDHLVAFWAGALVVAVCVSALGWSGTFVSICCAFVNVYAFCSSFIDSVSFVTHAGKAWLIVHTNSILTCVRNNIAVVNNIAVLIVADSSRTEFAESS